MRARLSVFGGWPRVLAVCLVIALPPVARATTGTVPAGSQAHGGPLGLKWLKSPGTARSVLANKLTFEREVPAEEAPYHTIDQYYSGSFGGVATQGVRLRFYKGEFFYLSVRLAYTAEGSPSQILARAIEEMRNPYGPPHRLTEPPRLNSELAILDNVPVGEGAPADRARQYLWNEQTRESDLVLHRLRDRLIVTGLWDPFAAWRFRNKVIVQVFMHREATPDGTAAVLTPVWIFAKEDVFKEWKKEVGRSKLIEPRDF